MPRYERIFWLDDCPDILGNVFTDGKQYGLDPKTLLPRVTWAYDFKTAADTIRQTKFDLYIIDGDFPDTVSDLEAKSIDSFLKTVDEHLRWTDDPLPICGQHPNTNHFAKFYREQLIDRTPVIVFSLSTMAPAIAFHLGLPFYGKALFKEDIVPVAEYLWDDTDYVQHYIPDTNSRKPKEHALTWEVGGREELIQNYLL